MSAIVRNAAVDARQRVEQGLEALRLDAGDIASALGRSLPLASSVVLPSEWLQVRCKRRLPLAQVLAALLQRPDVESQPGPDLFKRCPIAEK